MALSRSGRARKTAAPAGNFCERSRSTCRCCPSTRVKQCRSMVMHERPVWRPWWCRWPRGLSAGHSNQRGGRGRCPARWPSFRALAVCGLPLMLLRCGSTAAAPLSGDFAGAWSCADDGGPTVFLDITANGSQLNEILSTTFPGLGALSCTYVFQAMGSTAILDPSQTVCSGPAASTVMATPSSATQTVSGNVLMFSGTDPSVPITAVACTRQ